METETAIKTTLSMVEDFNVLRYDTAGIDFFIKILLSMAISLSGDFGNPSKNVTIAT